MDESQVLDAMTALSERTRLQMFRFLVTRAPEGAPAGEVGAAVGSSSSRSSFHLAVLTRAGIVTSERKSRQVIYRVDFAAVGGLVRYLIEDCCAGHPTVASCCTGRG